MEYSHHYGVKRFSKTGCVLIECINREFKETKEFQVTQWEKGKKQNMRNIKVVQQKLTGFFSDLPINHKDKK